MKISRHKIAGVIMFVLFAVICSLPNFKHRTSSSFLPNTRLNLGLDLRGGAHLLLDVDFEKYLQNNIELLSDDIRKELRDNRLGYKDMTTYGDTLSFAVRNNDELSKVNDIINNMPNNGMNIREESGIFYISFSDAKKEQLHDMLIEQSIEIVRMRVDEDGTKEPIIQRQGNRYILLQVAGVSDPTALKKILGRTAQLTFHLVDEHITQALRNGQDAWGRKNFIIPSDDIVVYGDDIASDTDGVKSATAVKKKPVISGNMLTSARATFDTNSRPAVGFNLSNVGARAFAEATRDNRGQRLAIVLDGTLISAPVINDPITGGNGIITGNFSVESSAELATLLRAGALPVPLKIVEERVVGPSLGQDSIDSGLLAGVVGLVSVMIFMAWSYGILGIFANVALVLAILGIIATLGVIQATLTLPGIAGIVLTIGMAVDANVLIYERIREELAEQDRNWRRVSNRASTKQYSLAYVINKGFDSAFATIADSNITTLLAALLLYIFGAGAVRGFAVTLSIGIASSMFCAIVITKFLLDLWIQLAKPKSIRALSA